MQNQWKWWRFFLCIHQKSTPFCGRKSTNRSFPDATEYLGEVALMPHSGFSGGGGSVRGSAEEKNKNMLYLQIGENSFFPHNTILPNHSEFLIQSCCLGCYGTLFVPAGGGLSHMASPPRHCLLKNCPNGSIGRRGNYSCAGVLVPKSHGGSFHRGELGVQSLQKWHWEKPKKRAEFPGGIICSS